MGHFEKGLSRQNAHKHNNTTKVNLYSKETKSLTFTETQNTKKRAKLKIVRTALYACICN